MTLTLVPIEEPPPSRINTSEEARRLAGTVGLTGRRVADALGKHWTTEAATERAKADCLAIARQSLELLEVLCREQK